MKFTSLFSSVVLSLLLAGPASVHAAGDQELQKEYDQVRKIALKDPKVRAAYQNADKTLNDTIVRIDPALKPMVDKQKTTASPTPQAKAHPASKPAPSKPAATKAHVQSSKHTVVKGETLSSIAAHYKVSTADLKKVNGIADEKKLKIGQVLTIPSAGHHADHAAKPSDSWWDRLKNTW